MKYPRLFVVLAVMLAAAVGGESPARAQPTPAFAYGKADDVKEVKETEWHAAAEVGLVVTTGNSETTTLTAGAKASRKTGQNKLELSASAAYANSRQRAAVDGDASGTIGPDELTSVSATTVEAIEGKLRYDRFLTDFDSLYVALLGRKDEPSGKELVAGAQVGYSRRLHKSDKHEVVGEVGYDFSYENPVAPGDALQIHSLRAFVGYKGAASATTSVDASLESLSNLNTLDTPTGEAGFFEDTRVNASAVVTSKVGADLSLSLSYQLKYDHVPAALAIPGVMFDPGFVPEGSSLDSILKAALIYSFF